MGSVTHPSRAADSVEMARLVFGPDVVEREHVIMGLANANSPMSWDFNMLGSAKAYAEANQIMLITPFILGGAMAPVTLGAGPHPDPRRGARRDGLLPDRAARCAGHLRLVRIVDVDADRGPDVRHPGAPARPVRPGRPGRPARRALPERRQLHRLQGARLPGGLRERHQLPGHDAGRRELQSAHGRLAGGWPGHRLREVHPRRGPGVDGRGVPGRRRPVRQRLALQAMLDGGPGQHFLGSPTRWPTSRLPSGGPSCPTTTLRAVGARRRDDAAQRANPAWKRRLAEYEEPHLDEAVDGGLWPRWSSERRGSPDSDV